MSEKVSIDELVVSPSPECALSDGGTRVRIEYKMSQWMEVNMPKRVYDHRLKDCDENYSEHDMILDLAREQGRRKYEQLQIADDDDSWMEVSFELDEVELEEGPELL